MTNPATDLPVFILVILSVINNPSQKLASCCLQEALIFFHQLELQAGVKHTE